MPRSALLATCALFTLAACAGADPVDSFDTRGVRVWEAYGQSGDRDMSVEVDASVVELWLRADCVADEGELELSTAQGGTVLACDRETGDSADFVRLQLEGPEDVDSLDITVTAPAEARWSAAVDVVTD